MHDSLRRVLPLEKLFEIERRAGRGEVEYLGLRQCLGLEVEEIFDRLAFFTGHCNLRFRLLSIISGLGDRSVLAGQQDVAGVP